jgi:hypothetical protein
MRLPKPYKKISNTERYSIQGRGFLYAIESDEEKYYKCTVCYGLVHLGDVFDCWCCGSLVHHECIIEDGSQRLPENDPWHWRCLRC